MDRNLGFDISETARLIRREANRRATAVGATSAQWRVLARLHRFGGGWRQVELADALDIEPITLCRMIDRMEESGLVERRRDPTDRRAWRIYLTEAASPVLVELTQLGHAFDGELTAGLTDAERTTLGDLLDRLRINLTQIGDARTEMEKTS